MFFKSWTEIDIDLLEVDQLTHSKLIQNKNPSFCECLCAIVQQNQQAKPIALKMLFYVVIDLNV